MSTCIMCGRPVLDPPVRRRGRPRLHCTKPCRYAWRAYQEFLRRMAACCMLPGAARSWKQTMWALGNDWVSASYKSCASKKDLDALLP